MFNDWGRHPLLIHIPSLFFNSNERGMRFTRITQCVREHTGITNSPVKPCRATELPSLKGGNSMIARATLHVASTCVLLFNTLVDTEELTSFKGPDFAAGSCGTLITRCYNSMQCSLNSKRNSMGVKPL